MLTNANGTESPCRARKQRAQVVNNVAINLVNHSAIKHTIARHDERGRLVDLAFPIREAALLLRRRESAGER